MGAGQHAGGWQGRPRPCGPAGPPAAAPTAGESPPASCRCAPLALLAHKEALHAHALLPPFPTPRKPPAAPRLQSLHSGVAAAPVLLPAAPHPLSTATSLASSLSSSLSCGSLSTAAVAPPAASVPRLPAPPLTCTYHVPQQPQHEAGGWPPGRRPRREPGPWAAREEQQQQQQEGLAGGWSSVYVKGLPEDADKLWLYEKVGRGAGRGGVLTTSSSHAPGFWPGRTLTCGAGLGKSRAHACVLKRGRGSAGHAFCSCKCLDDSRRLSAT